MHKLTTLRPLAVLGLGLLAGSSMAAELTANVGGTSNYVFRGFTQSDDGPAVQGGIDYTPTNGLYAGAWGSTIDCSAGCFGGGSGNGTGLEIDLYGGYNLKLSEDWGMDFGLIDYETTVSNRKSRTELYVGGRYRGFSLTYYDGHGSQTSDYTYLDFKVKVELQEKAFLLGHFGHTGYSGSADVNDWSVGVAKELWTVDFSLNISHEDLLDKTKVYLTGVKRFDIR